MHDKEGNRSAASLVFPQIAFRSAPSVRDFAARVTKDSGAAVLVEEAYFEFVEDPSYARLILAHSGRRPLSILVLTYSHTASMVFHMKTTLVIDDGVYSRLKQEAARHGVTISELVEAALRQLLTPKEREKKLPPLPTFNGGELLVDITDREALQRLFDQDEERG